MSVPKGDFLAHLSEQASGPVSSIRSERSLLAAVMARAICDAFGTAQCEKHIIRAARRWLFQEPTPKRPFSFAWTAIYLDLDPDGLQKELLDIQARGEMPERIAILRS